MASGLRIQSKRDVRIVTGAVTLLCIIMSETAVGLLWIFGGPGAFGMENAFLFAGIVPILLAVPITYYMAGLSLNLSEAHRELKRLADTDPLTTLPNRRSFFGAAEAALKRAEIDRSPCTLLVIDADHFKDINDSYGHAVGDKALIAIAEVLRTNFRQSDLICRVGGEEFAVLLLGMDAHAAQPLAQRVVKAVNNSPLSEANAIIEYSVSCGMADTISSYHLPSLFKIADDAMYTAKDRGRNQVVWVQAA